VVGGNGMPEVSRTEIGRRYFKLQKEKSVEQAIAKIRQSMGSDWSHYTFGDIEALKHILGESWVFIEREAWEKIAFTRLSGIELRELIAIGKNVLDNSINEQTAVEKSTAILMGSITPKNI
jgi:hypothetical protein